MVTRSTVLFLFITILGLAPPTAGARADSGIGSELRVGILAHDHGPFGSTKEGGADVNMEILFDSPSFLDWAWAPRPHIGISINTRGDTSQGYIGLSWQFDLYRGIFLGFSLGGAVHTGNLSDSDPDEKALGSRFLFRESLELGYAIDRRYRISLYLDHISNANLADHNEGIDDVGIRFGFMF